MKKAFGHKPGFSVPENYFGEFDGRLFAKLEKEGFLQEKTASGFKVPKSYFENFEVSPPRETKVIPLFKKRKVWAYASSIAAIFILALVLFTEEATEPVSFADIGEESLEMYFESGQIDFFNMESQILLLDEVEFGQTDFDEISDDAILDYLATHENELSYIDR
jgi:hypothetical protein